MKRKYEIVVLSKGAFARTVKIYSPKKATRAAIFFDGQAVFSDGDKTDPNDSLDALRIIKKLGIENVAIVAVDSQKARELEYLPFMPRGEENRGVDELYAFLSETLLPYSKKRFGYEKFALIGGKASALFALYAAARKNENICAYSLQSPPLFVSPAAFEDFFARSTFDKKSRFDVYASRAFEESEISDSYAECAFRVSTALMKSGVEKLNVAVDSLDQSGIFSKPHTENFLEKFARIS